MLLTLLEKELAAQAPEVEAYILQLLQTLGNDVVTSVEKKMNPPPSTGDKQWLNLPPKQENEYQRKNLLYLDPENIPLILKQEPETPKPEPVKWKRKVSYRLVAKLKLMLKPIRCLEKESIVVSRGT